MWPRPVSADKNVRKYISPKLCLTPEIYPKYMSFGTCECIGVGQTTVYHAKIKCSEFGTTRLGQFTGTAFLEDSGSDLSIYCLF